jgi:hypothetical protein
MRSLGRDSTRSYLGSSDRRTREQGWPERRGRAFESYSVALSGIDLLINTDDITIPRISGMAKHRTCRNFAEPEDIDSAMNGKMNEASIAVAHKPALVAISFFFCIAFIVAVPDSCYEVNHLLAG